LAASQFCAADICNRKSNVVGRKGKVPGYSKKEFPLTFADLYAKLKTPSESMCGKTFIKLLEGCLGWG